MLALLALAPLLQVAPGGDFELTFSIGLGPGTLPGGADTGAIAIVDGDTRFYGSSVQTVEGPEARIERRNGGNQQLWRRVIRRGSNLLYVAGLVPTDDGGVIVAMTEVEGPTFVASNVVAVRLDDMGNVVWETVIDPQSTITFPTNESVRASCAAADGAGGLWIGGVRVGTGIGVRPSLFHVAGNGALLPDVLPFGLDPTDVFDIEALPGGDLLIAGGSPRGQLRGAPRRGPFAGLERRVRGRGPRARRVGRALSEGVRRR